MKGNQKQGRPTVQTKKKNPFALDPSQWKFFLLKDLCTIDMGNKLDFSAMSSDDPTINFVGRSAVNNGVMGKVDVVTDLNPYPAGALTVALGGSLGSTYVQVEPFYTSQNVAVLQFDEEQVSIYARLFLANMIHFESQFKYFPFGRELNKYLRQVYGFILPVKKDVTGHPIIDPDSPYSSEGYLPDWQYMEDFIKSLNHKQLTTENLDDAVPKLDTAELVDFNFGRLVSDVYKATAFAKDDLVEVPYADVRAGGYLRYITRTGLDNGCEMIVARESALENSVESGNAISIGDTTATCFYQPEDFVAGDHMVVVRAEWLNPFTGNFIATLLNRESYRYSYGRAFVMKSIKTTNLKLPIKRNPDGTPVIDPKKTFHDDGYIPDWQFMEDYMRSLPYGDRIPEGGD